MWYSIDDYMINLSKVNLIQRSVKTLNFFRVVHTKTNNGNVYNRVEAGYLTVFSYTFYKEEECLKEFKKLNSILNNEP